MVVAFAGVFVCSKPDSLLPVSSSTTESKEMIDFSVESGFYTEGITVELQSAYGSELYYTLDGSVPEKGSEATLLYQAGIYLEAGETEQVYTIRAAAFENGTRVSDIVSRTYLCGTNAKSRYSTPVLVVTGSPDDFYNYEDGIMTHGKLDDEYIAAHPEWSEAFANKQIPVFGNLYQRGRAAEKEVAITLFDEDGNQILSQNGGFRVYGAISRMKNQPSFRLYARSEYDENNDFDYTFFEDQYTHEGTIQSEYKRIIVRNSGNDNGYGFIRSELATRIAKEAGFWDTPSSSPVCVYLNGQYYGVHWFITNFDDNYFTEAYGEYTGEMYVFEGQMNALEVGEAEEDTAYIELAEGYNEFMEAFANADLNDEANWQRLNEFMDVENFIQYIAIQHYLSNEDSLHNNFRVYRYYSPEGEYTEGTVFDGRFRFLLFDLDFAFGLIQEWSYEEPEKYTLTVNRMDGDQAYEKLFANILQREDCRQLYIQHTLSLMNYYYSEEYVKEALEEMHGSRAAELQYMIESTTLLSDNFPLMYSNYYAGYMKNALDEMDEKYVAEMRSMMRYINLLEDNYAAPDVADMDYIAHQMFLIERYTSLRPDYVKEDLQAAFGEMTAYTLHVDNPNQAKITVDYASVTDGTFSGSYFAEVPVSVSAQPMLGCEFDYWLVNGDSVEERALAIEAEDIQEGQVTLTCVCKPTENADLILAGVKAKNGDFIEITNLSNESKNLGDYFLSDNTSDRKSTLPASIIKPGETVIIYCKNYSEVEALGKPVTNFNIKAGETIALYRTNGELVDSVTVPLLGSDEGIWRKDCYTGEYREVIGE